MHPLFAPPRVIGHRGFRARYPENTLAGFAAAGAAGADMIELDVLLTRDRQVVVIHDETLDRTTDGRGRVADRTLDEIRDLDAGAWFDAGFASQRIPTLAEVLDMDGRPDAINIEIKTEAWEAGGRSDAVEMRVMDLLRARGLCGRVLVSSFDVRFLERLARLEDAPALALVTGRWQLDRVLEIARRLKLYSWHPDHRRLEAHEANAARQAGLRVFPWTVNHAADMRRLLAAGVDGIISDDPSRVPR